MIVITRRVGDQLSVGSGPHRVVITIQRLSETRVAISVENAATVERGEMHEYRLAEERARQSDPPAE